MSTNLPNKKKSSKEKSDKNDKKNKSSSSSSNSNSKSKEKKKEQKQEQQQKDDKQQQEYSYLQPSSDFEAGLIFNKYDPNHTGMLTANAFREMWKEQLGQIKSSSLSLPPSNGNRQQYLQQPILSSFDAGSVFAKFDSDQDGKLSKKEFEELILAHPELLSHSNNDLNSNTNININTQNNGKYTLPHEVITGRLLTHYDETAGVAIPKTSILSHEQMGNTVRPLIQAYSERFIFLKILL